MITSNILYIYKKDSKFLVLSHNVTLDIVKRHQELLHEGYKHLETINSQIFIEHRLNSGELKI